MSRAPLPCPTDAELRAVAVGFVELARHHALRKLIVETVVDAPSGKPDGEGSVPLEAVRVEVRYVLGPNDGETVRVVAGAQSSPRRRIDVPAAWIVTGPSPRQIGTGA